MDLWGNEDEDEYRARKRAEIFSSSYHFENYGMLENAIHRCRLCPLCNEGGRGPVLCPRPGGAWHASVTYFHSPGAASATGRGPWSPWRARCEGLQETVAHGREGHRRIRGRFSLRFRGSARIVRAG